MDQIELETMVASQLLRSPDLIYSMTIDILDIRSPEVREIIKAIKTLHVTGLTLSRPEIVRHCPNVSSAQMSHIAVATTNSDNFSEHIKDIRTCIRKDKLENLSAIILQALNDGDSPDMVISRIELYIAHLDESYENSKVLTTADMMQKALEELEEKMKNPGAPGVTTGFPGLDKLFGGFERSKLYYVGARPSEGKTALMLNMATTLLREAIPFGLISVESTLREVRARMLSIAGEVHAEDITCGDFDEKKLRALRSRVKSFASNPGRYYHNPHANIAEIESQVARMKAKEAIEVVFIDYAQLIECDGFAKRHEAVAHISRQLKAIALRLDVAVVALAQMKRDVDGRRAGMGDYGESSAFEKDADVLIAIEHNNAEMVERSKLRIIKARDGKTGEIDVEFNRSKLTFKEL